MLFQRFEDVQACAINPDAMTLDLTRTEDLINRLTEMYKTYDAMIVADATTGEVLVHNTKDYKGKPIGGQSIVGRDVSKEIGFSLRRWSQAPRFVAAHKSSQQIGC